jgi:hypothetical protein
MRRFSRDDSTTVDPSSKTYFQFGKTEALGPRALSFATHTEASSSAARTEFQFLSPEASLTFLKDVNNAR